jgi:pimeloyl-ACP methyl ester carboxylesterase
LFIGRSRAAKVLGLVVFAMLGIGCHPNERRAVLAEPTPARDAARPAVSAAPETPPAPPPARVERFRVPGDAVASIVHGVDKEPPATVFLAGICSNANAYLQTFPEAAQKQGGVVAIEGDQPCSADGVFRSYSWDAAKQHARIEAALAAAGRTEIPRNGITLVGYSQGAALAEQMVQRWPDRYSRLILIGAPTDPAPKNFVVARGVVTMSCDRDVPARMKTAAAGIAKAGTPSTYLQMPGCTHGNVTEGERVFSTAFDWLNENAKAPRPSAVPIIIAGAIPNPAQ